MDERRDILSDEGLSVRVINTLTKLGATTPQQVAGLRHYELLSQPNFGVKSLREVLQWLAKYGLTLNSVCPGCGRPLR